MMMMTRSFCHLFSLILLVFVYLTLEEATPPLSYHVTEEQVLGTPVANLSADVRLSPEVLSKIRFRFLSDSQPLFIIDPLSGVIRTSDVIDRDRPSLCRHQVTCVVHLDVALQPLQYFQVCTAHRDCVYLRETFKLLTSQTESRRCFFSAEVASLLTKLCSLLLSFRGPFVFVFVFLCIF